MIINNNISSLKSINAMSKLNLKISKTIEKLSTGLRINRASNDAAGLAISEKMRAQIKGLNSAERNIMDGISMIQTAEGALEEVHSMLQRIRELSVQHANGIYNTDDKATLEAEITQLKTQITNTVTKTTFNGIALFDNTAANTGISIQTGPNNGDTLVVKSSNLSTLANGINHADISTIDTAIKSVSTARATLGASQNRLEHSLNSVVNSSENLAAAESRIRDVDIAKEMAEYSKQQVLLQAGVSVAAQANQNNFLILKLLE